MLLTCFVFALLSPVCAVAQPWTSAGGAPDDSIAVAAVLERVAALHKNVILYFDPRPLRPDPEIISAAGPLARRLARATYPQVARRASAAAPLGFREGAIDAYCECPGILLSGPPELRGDRKPPTGCPLSGMVSVILASSRPGGAYLPHGGADHRAAARDGAWTVRVIVRQLTVWGQSSSALDAVLTRNSAGVWSVAQLTPLYIEE